MHKKEGKENFNLKQELNYNKNTNELKSSAKLHDRSETFK